MTTVKMLTHGIPELTKAIRESDPRTLCWHALGFEIHARNVTITTTYRKFGRADPLEAAELGRICAGAEAQIQDAMAKLKGRWVLKLIQPPRLHSFVQGRVPFAVENWTLENLLCLTSVIRFVRVDYGVLIEEGGKKYEWAKTRFGEMK